MVVVVGGRLEGGAVVVVERRRRTACLGAGGLEWKACVFDDGGRGGRAKESGGEENKQLMLMHSDDGKSVEWDKKGCMQHTGHVWVTARAPCVWGCQIRFLSKHTLKARGARWTCCWPRTIVRQASGLIRSAALNMAGCF